MIDYSVKKLADALALIDNDGCERVTLHEIRRGILVCDMDTGRKYIVYGSDAKLVNIEQHNAS